MAALHNGYACENTPLLISWVKGRLFIADSSILASFSQFPLIHITHFYIRKDKNNNQELIQWALHALIFCSTWSFSQTGST